MSDRPTKKSKTIKLSPSSSLTPSPEKPPSVVIVNEARSDKVDFTIVVNEQSVETRYGVEKTALALHSTFFGDLFDEHSKKDAVKAPKEYFEITDEFSDEVVRLALNIFSGIVDKKFWTIDESLDVLKFGRAYCSDILVQYGLQKFCGAFVDAYTTDGIFNSDVDSRYGESAFIGFIGLWHQMVNRELTCSPEIEKMYHWGMQTVLSYWSENYSTELSELKIEDFIDENTSVHCSCEDVCITAKYIEKVKHTGSRMDLGYVLRGLFDK